MKKTETKIEENKVPQSIIDNQKYFEQIVSQL